MRKDLEDRLEQEEESEPTYGNSKETGKNKKGKTKARNDNKEDKGMSKIQNQNSELVDSKIIEGNNGSKSESPEVNDQIQMKNTALPNNAEKMSDSKPDIGHGQITKRSITTELCATDKTQFSVNTETCVTNDTLECEEGDRGETSCGDDFCTDINVNENASECLGEIEDNEEGIKRDTEEYKELWETNDKADQQNSNDNSFAGKKYGNETANVDNGDTHEIEKDLEGTVMISNDTEDCEVVLDDS